MKRRTIYRTRDSFRAYALVNFLEATEDIHARVVEGKTVFAVLAPLDLNPLMLKRAIENFKSDFSFS